MGVIGCVRNGVNGLGENDGSLEARENEERKCGFQLVIYEKEIPLDIQRQLLFWEAEKAYHVQY